jgi:hypothetical protein
MFAGMAPRVGGVVSTTLTLKLALAVFPWESVAVQLTFVVVARTKMLPEGGAQTGVTLPSTMSVALVEYVTVVPPTLVASAVRFPGVVIDGGVVSWTVIVRTTTGPVVSPVITSVAVQITGVTPIGKVAPELWSQAIVGDGLSSVAVIENVATAPAEDVASRV